MKNLSFSILFCFVSILLSAQTTTAYRDFVSRDTLQKHVKFLASDSLKGRDTGSEGQLIAADYINNAFIRYGLEGINPQHPTSSYYQDIDLNYLQFPKVKLIIDSDSILFRYRITASDDNFKNEMRYQFCGNGSLLPKNIEEGVNTILVNYDENLPVDKMLQNVKDRTDVRQVVIMMPKDRGEARVFKRLRYAETDYGRRYYYAGPETHPLLDMVMNNPDTTMHFMFVFKQSIEYFTGKERSHWKKMQKKIMKKGYASVEKKALLGERHIDVSGNYQRIQLDAPNVIGLLTGKDTSRTIVVGGHYDHLGFRKDKIYNGADDNASGTAGVMELARIFSLAKANGDVPPCNILFMAYTAEEKGLFGSKYYTENPLIPLEQTIGMFNMDMIGRQEWLKKSDGEPYVYMLRRRDGRDMKRMVKRLDKTDNYDLTVLHGHGLRGLLWVIGSDHYWFMRNGIPVAVFFTASHDDYHQPTDTEEKITYNSMTEIVRLVYDAMGEWGTR